MVLDVPPKTLGEVPNHLTFINTAHGGPALALVIAYSLPETCRQVPLPHPPLCSSSLVALLVSSTL
uniref:Uncharacterized protein n=1 Tax=Ficus carica TaxID=3494 RepID=A0AA87ZFL4_FICCA|nr:hypothetical protein TIFTF001_040463 [Ficus carica]GMN23796.1 hypothetical protein TIFTF001_040495 [Ficus carica]